MLYNYVKNEVGDIELKDSLTLQEEAYINSPEYRNIAQQINWVVISIAAAELAGILLWIFV
jgi:hypothetical protein